MTTTDEDAGPTPRESAPSAATARPRVELARALDRDTLRRILDRIDRGKTLTDAQRHALRRTTTAEQADADQARADANRHKANYLSACKTIAEMHAAATGSIGQGPVRGVVEDVADVRSELLATRDGIGQLRTEHETRRHALIEAIELPDATDWPRITQAAADLRRAATAEADRADGLGAAFRARRHALADALGLDPGTARTWSAITEAVRENRADWDRCRAEAERNAAADVAAARQAEQQAGETLTTRHRQLADALGLGALTSWPDLIETARRVFEAGPVRRAAVVDAEQALAAAEQRARDTAATLRETEQQLAATRRDAADARIRAGHAWAERNRYRDAWHNARRRAQVYDALVTTTTARATAAETKPREVCCVCGCPDVVYHNHRNRPFCCRCAACCEPPVLCAHGCQPPTEPEPPAEPDGAALWAAIRDHAARDHRFWDRLQREHRSRPAGFPVSLR